MTLYRYLKAAKPAPEVSPAVEAGAPVEQSEVQAGKARTAKGKGAGNAKDREILNRKAAKLNQEARDVLDYQAKP